MLQEADVWVCRRQMLSRFSREGCMSSASKKKKKSFRRHCLHNYPPPHHHHYYCKMKKQKIKGGVMEVNLNIFYFLLQTSVLLNYITYECTVIYWILERERRIAS